MMGLETNLDDVEALLSRDTRARLPLWRQVLLYLNPFALFKDAARGPVSMRERALAYNRAMRWVLLPYIRRYILIAAVLFLGIAPTEALAAEYKGRITVNAVLPSIIDTAANRASMPNADFTKWVAPKELADVILFLASDAASAVTGALLPVSGRV